MNVNEINKNIYSQFPFKKEQNVIKSDWRYSFWDRKQVKIKATTSGELAVQTVAQNIFNLLVSKCMKFIWGHQIKSIGKKVESFNVTGYNLPSNLVVPLSEQKKKDLVNLQCELLGLFFLPTHKKLSNLGTELIEVALQDPETCGQVVRDKIFDMCQEILDFQLVFTEVLQKDLPPAELYAKFQEYDQQAENYCREFPLALKDFIEKNKVVEAPPKEEIKEIEVVEKEILTQKKIYSALLNTARTKIDELKTRRQFTSAEWSEKELENIVKGLANEENDALSLRSAIEALEDVLDCTENDIGFTTQLQLLSPNSPYEKQLKGLVIQDIKHTLANFLKACKAKDRDIIKLLQDSEPFPWTWHQELLSFFETTQEKVKGLNENHNSFESSIPGLEMGMHWLNPWMGNVNPLIPLESLDRELLIKHTKQVENFCTSTLAFIENETQMEKIFKLSAQYKDLNNRALQTLDQLDKKHYLHRAELQKIQKEQAAAIESISTSLASSNHCWLYVTFLEKGIAALQNKLKDIEKRSEINLIDQLLVLEELGSPLYESLRSRLIEESKTKLESFIDVLKGYNNTLTAASPILVKNRPDMIDSLLQLGKKIKAKIAQAQALTVDFSTRLHVFQIFNEDVAINELPAQQLKDYMNKVSHLVVRGLEEITQEAEHIGIKF